MVSQMDQEAVEGAMDGTTDGSIEVERAMDGTTDGSGSIQRCAGSRSSRKERWMVPTMDQ